MQILRGRAIVLITIDVQSTIYQNKLSMLTKLSRWTGERYVCWKYVYSRRYQSIPHIIIHKNTRKKRLYRWFRFFLGMLLNFSVFHGQFLNPLGLSSSNRVELEHSPPLTTDNHLLLSRINQARLQSHSKGSNSKIVRKIIEVTINGLWVIWTFTWIDGKTSVERHHPLNYRLKYSRFKQC